MKVFIATALALSAIGSAAFAQSPTMNKRQEERAEFSAKEKVHAQKLAEEHAAAPAKLKAHEEARARLSAREKGHAQRLAADRAASSAKAK